MGLYSLPQLRCLQGLLKHKDELIEMLREGLSEKESKVVAVLAEKFSLSKDYMAYLAERREKKPEILRTGTTFCRPRGPSDDKTESPCRTERWWSRQQGTRERRRTTEDSVRSSGDLSICTQRSKSPAEGVSRQTSNADDSAVFHRPSSASKTESNNLSQTVERADSMNMQLDKESGPLSCSGKQQGSQAGPGVASHCLGPYSRFGSTTCTERGVLSERRRKNATASEAEETKAFPVFVAGLSHYGSEKSAPTVGARPSLPLQATKRLESRVTSAGAAAKAAFKEAEPSAALKRYGGKQETDDSGVLVTEEETVYLAGTRSFEDSRKQTESSTPQHWVNQEWIDSSLERGRFAQQKEGFNGKGKDVPNFVKPSLGHDRMARPERSSGSVSPRDASSSKESARDSAEWHTNKKRSAVPKARRKDRTTISEHEQSIFKRAPGSRLKAEVFFDTLMAQTRARLDRHMEEREFTGVKSAGLRQTLKAYEDVQQVRIASTDSVLLVRTPK